jgi:hypothetical protein
MKTPLISIESQKNFDQSEGRQQNRYPQTPMIESNGLIEGKK